MITKDQALESLSRFVGGHLKTDKRPTVSMPMRPTDDDAVVTGYIEQLEAEVKGVRWQLADEQSDVKAAHMKAAAQMNRIAELEAENKLLRQQREAHLETISRAEACFVCGDRVLKAKP